VYICPKCNVETTEPKQHTGHNPERKRSVGFYVLAGIGFSLFFFVMAGFVHATLMNPPPRPDETGAWIIVYGLTALLGPLPVIGGGIWAVRRGAKYKRSGEPTASLAPQNSAIGWTLIAMFCAWIILGIIKVSMRQA